MPSKPSPKSEGVEYMKTMRHRLSRHEWSFLFLVAGFALLVCAPTVQAARRITVTAVSMPTDVVMQSATTYVSVKVTNSNTGGNTGQNINSVQFTAAAGYTWNIGAIVPPAGWRVSGSSTTTKLIFTTTSNTVPPKIAVNQSQTFNLVLGAIPTAGQDALNTSWLSQVIAKYDSGGNTKKGNPFTWNVRSFYMTLVASPSAATKGTIITLVMTVTNRSSNTQSGIVSNPSPPTKNLPASGFSVTQQTGPTPASLSLAPNATNSITWTYLVGVTGSNCPTGAAGTVSFTAQARNSTGSATSGPAITSNTVSLGCIIAGVSIPSCGISGGGFTITMTVYNYNTGGIVSPLSNAIWQTDTSSTASGAATCGSPTYPSPNSVPAATAGSPPTPGTNTITWACLLPSTALSGQTYIVDGQVTGFYTGNSTSYTTPWAVSNTLTFVPATTSVVPNPSTISAGSTNVLIAWMVTNGGCSSQSIKNVQITAPTTDWTYLASSEVVNGAYDWTDSLTQASPAQVTYFAGTQLPLGGTGEFDIVFSLVPSTPNSYIFNVVLTDASNNQTTIPTTITVGPVAAGGTTDSGPEQEMIP